ncbi:nascent polypeptide-associated complex subunit alpha, muscle-specific form-like [Brachypodium distachyon]|uniref:nascent polypeptide-associated complex subunit alpha, muscle-specific form-like n=1 Tax=Brachypodium distachyon TaxID=15368 RepID=UPI000D0D9FFA|nr:nascent polypeptide-associated complex subunit alpha, muscle-specific form-like [Brachypodium distachyon]|eukprot:XP_024317619.1 nascent polypeptide-associated complex subunit alpha, muscle-specific form-like [Brachypodium distachyon]
MEQTGDLLAPPDSSSVLIGAPAGVPVTPLPPAEPATGAAPKPKAHRRLGLALPLAGVPWPPSATPTMVGHGSAAPPLPAATTTSRKRVPCDPSAPASKRPAKKAPPAPPTASLPPPPPPPAASGPAAPAPPLPPVAPAPAVTEVFDGMPERTASHGDVHGDRQCGTPRRRRRDCVPWRRRRGPAVPHPMAAAAAWTGTWRDGRGRDGEGEEGIEWVPVERRDFGRGEAGGRWRRLAWQGAAVACGLGEMREKEREKRIGSSGGGIWMSCYTRLTSSVPDPYCFG